MCAAAALVENKWLSEESRRAVMGANIPPIFSRNSSIIFVCGDGWKRRWSALTSRRLKPVTFTSQEFDSLFSFRASVLKQKHAGQVGDSTWLMMQPKARARKPNSSSFYAD